MQAGNSTGANILSKRAQAAGDTSPPLHRCARSGNDIFCAVAAHLCYLACTPQQADGGHEQCVRLNSMPQSWLVAQLAVLRLQPQCGSVRQPLRARQHLLRDPLTLTRAAMSTRLSRCGPPMLYTLLGGGCGLSSKCSTMRTMSCT